MVVGLKLGLGESTLENINRDRLSQLKKGHGTLVGWTRSNEATRTKLCQAILSLSNSGRIVKGLRSWTRRAALSENPTS